MFISINDYCTKKAALAGAAQRGGGWAMVAALAATYITPCDISSTRSTLH